MCKRFFCVLLFALSHYYSIVCSAQTYVADTLLTKFKNDTSSTFNYSINVSDHREGDPRFISVYEKKKWLFFPVDQIVFTTETVAKSFENRLNSASGQQFLLGIYNFYISNDESAFSRSMSLNGAFQLSRIQTNGDTTLMGSFYYENSVKNKKKVPVESSYSDVISQFRTGFMADLAVVCADTVKNPKVGEYHFRKGAKVAPKNFYISADAFYGYTFWGFDAELWFSSPEPSQKFNRTSRIFRYLNYGNRQSVALSAGVKQFNYRVNANWLFQNKSVFLFGVNKWNDIDEEQRTLEELFLFQYSMTQLICFNRLDKSGFIVGAGLREELSYIIHNQPIYGLGLVLSCGYKF